MANTRKPTQETGTDLEPRVTELESDVAQLQLDFKSLGNRIYALETGITVPQDQQSNPQQPAQQQDDLEARVSELERDVHQLQTNYKDLGNRVYTLETGITVPQVTVTPTPPPSGSLEERIVKLERNVSQLQLNSENLNERVTALEEKEQQPEPPDSDATLQELVNNGGAVILPKDNYNEVCSITKPTQVTGKPTTIDVTGMTISNQKGIFDAQESLELDGLVMKGAKVPDKNGTAVRGSNNVSIKLTNCEIFDCEMGILTGTGGKVELSDCNIYDNGASDGQSHEIYVGPADELVVDSCILVAGNKSCRPLKSRAKQTTVLDTHMKGSPSRDTRIVGSVVDICEGGEVLIENSIIESIPGTPITALLSYAFENTNAGVGTVILCNVKVIDGRGNGGSIESRNSGARLVLENCTHTANNPPALNGWGNVSGQFTRA